MARGRTKVRSRRQRGDANAEDAQNGKKQKPVLSLVGRNRAKTIKKRNPMLRRQS